MFKITPRRLHPDCGEASSNVLHAQVVPGWTSLGLRHWLSSLFCMIWSWYMSQGTVSWITKSCACHAWSQHCTMLLSFAYGYWLLVQKPSAGKEIQMIDFAAFVACVVSECGWLSSSVCLLRRSDQVYAIWQDVLTVVKGSQSVVYWSVSGVHDNLRMGLEVLWAVSFPKKWYILGISAHRKSVARRCRLAFAVPSLSSLWMSFSLHESSFTDVNSALAKCPGLWATNVKNHVSGHVPARFLVCPKTLDMLWRRSTVVVRIWPHFKIQVCHICGPLHFQRHFGNKLLVHIKLLSFILTKSERPKQTLETTKPCRFREMRTLWNPIRMPTTSNPQLTRRMPQATERCRPIIDCNVQAPRQ